MDENELVESSDGIVIIGTAIVGCELPFTDTFSNTISEQLISYIKDFGFEELTEAEIILALKINLQNITVIEMENVSFTGRCMNVAFFSKILSNYFRYRNFLDRKIQNLIDGYK